MALAVLTNMTAAPYALGCLVYLVVRRRWRLFLCFAVPFAAILIVVVAGFEIATGAYIENVIHNQVGSYPRSDTYPGGLWGYVWYKLVWQGSKILEREGGYILMALLGLALYNRSDTRPEREFLVWYALILLLSVVYVTKGGTADYIFTIGEPAVALFAAYFLCQFLHPATHQRLVRQPIWRDTSVVVQVAAVALVLVVVGYPGVRFMGQVLRQQQFEQRLEGRMRRDENGVPRARQDGLVHVEYYIRKYSKPGDRILAAPYYAFVTGRLLIEEYSELFLLSLKQRLERLDGVEGDGIAKIRAIAAELEARRVPIVIANISPLNPLILSSPEVRGAVRDYYKPVLDPDKTMKTLNYDIQIFVPKTDEELRAAPAGE